MNRQSIQRLTRALNNRKPATPTLRPPLLTSKIGNSDRIGYKERIFPYSQSQIVDAIRETEIEFGCFGFSVILIRVLRSLGEHCHMMGLFLDEGAPQPFHYFVRWERYGNVDPYPEGNHSDIPLSDGQYIDDHEWNGDEKRQYDKSVIKILEKLSGGVRFIEIEEELEKIKRVREGL